MGRGQGQGHAVQMRQAQGSLDTQMLGRLTRLRKKWGMDECRYNIAAKGLFASALAQRQALARSIISNSEVNAIRGLFLDDEAEMSEAQLSTITKQLTRNRIRQAREALDTDQPIDQHICKCLDKFEGQLDQATVEDVVRGDGPVSEALRLATIAEGLQAARSDSLSRNGMEAIGPDIERHHQLAKAAGPEPSRHVAVVPDTEWLFESLQLPGEGWQGSEATGAYSLAGGIPLMTAEAAAAHKRGGINSTLLHELIHSTQPEPVGEDEGTRVAVDWEEMLLLEGVTEAIATRAMEDNDPTALTRDYYAPYRLATETLARRLAPEHEEQFLQRLSSIPTGERRRWIEDNYQIPSYKVSDFIWAAHEIADKESGQERAVRDARYAQRGLMVEITHKFKEIATMEPVNA